MFGVACFFVVRLAWNIGMESSSGFVQILSSIIVGSAGEVEFPNVHGSLIIFMEAQEAHGSTRRRGEGGEVFKI